MPFMQSAKSGFFVEVAGLYWKAHQDGLDYALETSSLPQLSFVDLSGFDSIKTHYPVIDGKVLSPKFKWNFGFKLGAGFISVCDGWDIGAVWTRYKGRASSENESEMNTRFLQSYWSAFGVPLSGVFLITDDIFTNTSAVRPDKIETFWHLDLDLIDIDLGREFCISSCFTLRPSIGVRLARLDQDFNIEQCGGNVDTSVGNSNPAIDRIDLRNDFWGAGIHPGLESNWCLGCGWSLYGELGLSVLFGRFTTKQEETLRATVSPFGKTDVFELDNRFESCKYSGDVALGVQWSRQFCECRYGVDVQLGWEGHIFPNQNQLIKTNNDLGKVALSPARGDLSAQGGTLTFKFIF